LSLFAVLSLTDLALTCFLVGRSGGGAYEWNPVASWWLVRFGWAGLAGFKLSIVLLVAVLTLVISWHRSRTAGRVLGFGCAVLLAVILHSGLLVPGVLADADHIGRLEGQTQLLDRQLVRASAYSNLIHELGKDLVSGRRSLVEALELLSTAEQAHDPEWLWTMARRYPGLTKRELLAARLIQEAVRSATGGLYESGQVYRELNAQFRSCFGRSAPRPAMTWEEELEAPS
jgi:hypothetical protein